MLRIVETEICLFGICHPSTLKVWPAAFGCDFTENWGF